MDAATKTAVMHRYHRHLARFERAAEDRRRRGLAREEHGDQAAQSQPGAEALTHTESRVLELIARGFTDAEIGSQIGISANTAKAHVRRVLAKLQARNRAHAVALGLEHEVLRPPPHRERDGRG